MLVTRGDTMIQSFADKTTLKIWLGERSKELPIEIQQVARRKLRMINSSQNLQDLRIPPSNNLEKLQRNTQEFLFNTY